MVGRLAQPGGQLMGLLDDLQSQLAPFYVVIRNKKRECCTVACFMPYD